MSVLRLISFSTDVSTYALNLSSALGLALAIDYTLLIISRYRDELADGSGRDEALIRTMATAGRTVLFSATTVALSMAVMVLFPMYFLKSFAYAGRGHRGIRRGGRDRGHTGGDRAARSAAGCAGRARARAADTRPPGPGAQAGGAIVLVSVDQVRHATSGARSGWRSSRCCWCWGFRSSG